MRGYFGIGVEGIDKPVNLGNLTSGPVPPSSHDEPENSSLGDLVPDPGRAGQDVHYGGRCSS
jgi:hypothetical protein